MRSRLLILAGSLLAAQCGVVAAQAISVGAGVQRGALYVDEPFRYQIVVEGVQEAPEVDLAPLAAWRVKELGGQDASQSMTTIINGRRSERVTKRYILNYTLTGRAAGRQQVPAVEVRVQGKRYRTNPVAVDLIEPETSDAIVLETALSVTRCYVGEPVTLTVNWYVAANVGDFGFLIPALEDAERFVVDDGPMPSGGQDELVRIALGDGEVVGRKRQVTRQGKAYLLVSFAKVLTPRRAGTVTLAGAKVQCNVEVAGTGRRRTRSVFDDPFFGRPEYQRVQAAAEPLTLEVVPLPTEGQPTDFSGLVGRYGIATEASPTTVNVGDPITFRVRVSGPLLQAVERPDLHAMAGFAGKFRIPTEQSAPEIKGGEKVFTYTIRALDAELTEIPAATLSYFDSDKGAYVTTQSEAIPLAVTATRVVTAADAVAADLTPQARRIEAVREGIAANHDRPEMFVVGRISGMEVLTAPVGWAALLAGPMVFAGSLAARLAVRRDPRRDRMRLRTGALKIATKQLGRSDEAGTVLREYVDHRLGRSGMALTAVDCEQLLGEAGVAEEVVQRFRAALAGCDESRYGGGGGDVLDKQALVKLLREVDRATR